MSTHETYVSFETAKLLKEARFDWECNYAYTFSDNEVVNKAFLSNWSDTFIDAPTLAVAQKWLREVKNIDVVVSRAMQWRQFYYTIAHEENRTSKIDFMSLNEDLWWLKYEEALEAGIKKALEIILEGGELLC
jgi:hypothetical protein